MGGGFIPARLRNAHRQAAGFPLIGDYIEGKLSESEPQSQEVLAGSIVDGCRRRWGCAWREPDRRRVLTTDCCPRGHEARDGQEPALDDRRAVDEYRRHYALQQF